VVAAGAFLAGPRRVAGAVVPTPGAFVVAALATAAFLAGARFVGAEAWSPLMVAAASLAGTRRVTRAAAPT